MKKTLALLLVPVLAGCLSSRPPTVSRWGIEYDGPKATDATPKYGVARFSQVIVRSPYNAESMPVLRPGGTMAFDAYNEFAALPATQLRGVIHDAMEASGQFKAVVGAESSVATRLQVEVVVTKLALDCRRQGARQAVAEVMVRVLDGREIAAIARGEGEADASDGNYGRAFSRAVSAALSTAFGDIP